MDDGREKGSLWCMRNLFKRRRRRMGRRFLKPQQLSKILSTRIEAGLLTLGPSDFFYRIPTNGTDDRKLPANYSSQFAKWVDMRRALKESHIIIIVATMPFFLHEKKAVTINIKPRGVGHDTRPIFSQTLVKATVLHVNSANIHVANDLSVERNILADENSANKRFFLAAEG